MMKKNIFAPFLIALLLFLPSCGSETAAPKNDVDLETVASELAKSSSFEEQLNRVDDKFALKLYDISNASAVCLYTGSGATADELALFEFENEDDAKGAVKSAQERIDAQKESFAGYLPKELPKLDSAVIKTYGHYLVICVCTDSNMEDMIEKFFE